MQWCNCSYDDYELLANVNELGCNNTLTCWRCNNRITNEDLILLLIKKVRVLDQTIQGLEFEKIDREKIKIDEEYDKMILDKIAKENANKQTERFELLDL